MTEKNDTGMVIDELGASAWAILASEMKRIGPVRALQDMLVRAPHALRQMVDWLDEQPIERRVALCEAAFGKAVEPRGTIGATDL